MQTCLSRSPSASEGEAPTHEAGMSACENAHWTIDDKTFLIHFLSLKTIDTTTSNNMFKDAVFKEAAEALKGYHPHVKGGKKTMASCKSKWSRVCISLYAFYPYPNLYA
jgi:hypothetical protein